MFLDRNTLSLREHFNRSFEIVQVDSDLLLEEVLRLRYQVFCIENRLADNKKFTNSMEQDLYDHRSVHRLVRHKETGTFIAHVRLILPDLDNPEDRFPMENYCKITDQENLIFHKKVSRTSLAEVSRFLISKERERQVILATATSGAGSIYRKEDGPHSFLLLHGLITAGLRMAMEIKSTYLYACIQTPLFRLLRKFGIHFIKIGPPVEYHGLRFPCLGTTESFLSGIYKHRPDLWELITEDGELAPQIQDPSLCQN